MWSNVCSAIVFVAFIGGCTYTITNADDGKSMQDCIAANYEWIGGDCVKGK